MGTPISNTGPAYFRPVLFNLVLNIQSSREWQWVCLNDLILCNPSAAANIGKLDIVWVGLSNGGIKTFFFSKSKLKKKATNICGRRRRYQKKKKTIVCSSKIRPLFLLTRKNGSAKTILETRKWLFKPIAYVRSHTIRLLSVSGSTTITFVLSKQDGWLKRIGGSLLPGGKNKGKWNPPKRCP